MSLGKRKKKSEHAGAKNGGGHWGTRNEAKRISKKVRRSNDKAAIKSELPTSTMIAKKDQLRTAIQLRDKGQKEASCAMLLRLCSLEPKNPEYLYHCAWTHDGMGLEREAVSFYERAIASGLSGENLTGALLGLGSTLRGLGQYAKAVKVLERGIKNSPGNQAMRVFHAMALYNTGQMKPAVETLLKLLATTTLDKDIQSFTRAILFYAEDLDRTWEH